MLYSVLRPRHSMGYIASGLSISAHVTHSMGLLQVGTEDSGEEPIPSCDVGLARRRLVNRYDLGNKAC
jgi:hypothetical protein